MLQLYTRKRPSLKIYFLGHVQYCLLPLVTSLPAFWTAARLRALSCKYLNQDLPWKGSKKHGWSELEACIVLMVNFNHATLGLRNAIGPSVRQSGVDGLSRATERFFASCRACSSVLWAQGTSEFPESEIFLDLMPCLRCRPTHAIQPQFEHLKLFCCASTAV